MSARKVFHAEVRVTPKQEVADPQGQAIEAAIARLGLAGEEGAVARRIRVGRVFHLEIEAADQETARRALERLADKVLHNPNIEEFSCSLSGAQ